MTSKLTTTVTCDGEANVRTDFQECKRKSNIILSKLPQLYESRQVSECKIVKVESGSGACMFIVKTTDEDKFFWKDISNAKGKNDKELWDQGKSYWVNHWKTAQKQGKTSFIAPVLHEITVKDDETQGFIEHYHLDAFFDLKGSMVGRKGKKDCMFREDWLVDQNQYKTIKKLLTPENIQMFIDDISALLETGRMDYSLVVHEDLAKNCESDNYHFKIIDYFGEWNTDAKLRKFPLNRSKDKIEPNAECRSLLGEHESIALKAWQEYAENGASAYRSETWPYFYAQRFFAFSVCTFYNFRDPPSTFDDCYKNLYFDKFDGEKNNLAQVKFAVALDKVDKNTEIVDREAFDQRNQKDKIGEVRAEKFKIWANTMMGTYRK